MIHRLQTDITAGVRQATARIKSRVAYTLISIVGVAVAVTCVAGTLTFLDNVSTGILAVSLDEKGSGALDVQLRGRLRPFVRESHIALTEQVHLESTLTLGEAAGPVYRGFRSPTFVPSILDPSDPLDRRRGFFGSVHDFTDRIDIVEGTWPPPATETISTRVVDVLIERSVALKYGLANGDEFAYSPPSGNGGALSIRVAALFDRSEAGSPYWRVVDEGFSVAGSSFELIPMFVTEGDFPALAENARQGGEASYFWLATVKPDRISAGHAGALVDRLDLLAARLSVRLSGFQMVTATDEAIAVFTRRNTIAAIPMKTIMLAISGIALVLVLLVGSHTSDLTRSDDATVAARGASRRQRLISTLAEAFIVSMAGTATGFAIGAFVMGPFGAAAVIGGLNFDFQMPGTWTVVASVLVGVAGAGMFAASSISSGSLLVTRLQRNRSNQTRLPFFTRYYLDLVVVVVALVIAWQVSSGGIHIAEKSAGQGRPDQLALALPAIGVIGLGAVGVRMLPAVFALLAAALARMPSAIGKSTVFELGLKSLARRTSHQGKLVVMIAATAATAVLLSSFESTITSSNSDQSAYRVGADIRAVGLTYRSQWRIDRALDQVANVDGVASVSGVIRASGIIRGADSPVPAVILGIDPDELWDIAWDRVGVGSAGTLELLRSSEKLRGLPVPGDAGWISVNVKPVTTMSDVGLVVKLADSTGRLHSLTLGTLEPRSSAGSNEKFPCANQESQEFSEPEKSPDWCEIGVSLVELRDSLPPGEPLSLEFLGFSRRPIEGGVPPRVGSMLVDRIYTHRADVADVLLWFGESDERNTVGGGYGDHGARIDDAGQDGALISWTAPAFGTYRGIDLAPVGKARTIIGSDLIRQKGFEVGDLMEIAVGDRTVRVRIGGFAEHFPTLNPSVGPFIIASRDTVWKALALDSAGIGAPMNEIWISAPGATGGLVTDEIRNVLNANSINVGSVRQQIDSEAAKLSGLESASWRFILGFGYTVLTVAAIVGVVVHTVGSFSLRRVEFSVLRSLGLGKLQLTTMILFESLTVIIFAAAIGTGAGRVIALATIPYLTGEDPSNITPPMLLWTDWGTLAIALAVFASAVLVNLGLIAFMASTRSVHAEIRMGSR
ncbi:MAG: ABC transporter permease [Chloroflexi bacterium]|nr:ABC transporter permease [Chloroflexota bacterium]